HKIANRGLSMCGAQEVNTGGCHRLRQLTADFRRPRAKATICGFEMLRNFDGRCRHWLLLQERGRLRIPLWTGKYPEHHTRPPYDVIIVGRARWESAAGCERLWI